MAILFDAPVTPDALTAFVREVPTPSTLALSAMFPEEQTDTNTIDWSEIISTNRTARFRSFDGRIHVSDRDGSSDKRVSLLPFSDSLNMGEYERLQLEFARTGGTSSVSPLIGGVLAVCWWWRAPSPSARQKRVCDGKDEVASGGAERYGSRVVGEAGPDGILSGSASAPGTDSDRAR